MALDKNKKTKRLQWITTGLIAIALIGIYVFLKQKSENLIVSNIDDDSKITISRIDKSNSEDSWIEQSEIRLQSIEDQVDQIYSQNKELIDQTKLVLAEQQALIINSKKAIERQQLLIEEVTTAVVVPPQTPTTDPFDVSNSQAPQINGQGQSLADDFGTDGGLTQTQLEAVTSLVRFELPQKNIAGGGNIEVDPFNVENSEVVSPPRSPENWLAAGSHAPGIIIAGAAAAVSASGQADPRPVVLRIIDQAHSASDKRGKVVKTDIRGCTITGEARGDLSSERVYVRLIKMTCARDGGLIETSVKGFVAGGGQAGVRGPVIQREGDLIQKSFLAGVLSGFGDAASDGLNPQALVIDRTAKNQESDSSILGNAGKAGVAKGIGNAGNRLAEYYISRAEQYQPIVSLRPGTPIQVVFLEGSPLYGTALGEGQ